MQGTVKKMAKHSYIATIKFNFWDPPRDLGFEKIDFEAVIQDIVQCLDVEIGNFTIWTGEVILLSVAKVEEA